MTTFPATEAKNRFGELLDAANKEPVEIAKQGRSVAVILSKKDYDDMQRRLNEAEKPSNLDWVDGWLSKSKSNPRRTALDEKDYHKHLDEKFGQ